MNEPTQLTICLMDPPFESARSTTAMRLMSICATRGYRVHVFAYEGAVALPFVAQTAHANAVHGHDAEQENHPLPHVWVRELMALAKRNGGALNWINCGLCVDERGVHDAVEGVRRGTPADLFACAKASDNTLIIPTR